MRRYISSVICIAVVLATIGAGSEEALSEPGPRADRSAFAGGRILVKLEEGAQAKTLRSLNERNDARTEDKLPRVGVNVVDLPGDLTVTEAVRRYEASAGVEYAEPDYEIHPEAAPSDPDYPRLYGLNNTGQVPGSTPDADIDAPEAWGVTTGSANTVVAVIDTGVDINHPDLDDNVWTNPDEAPGNGIDDDGNGYVDDVHGWDFFHNDASVFDSSPDDDHGTHVAGTIAAEGNNGIGVTGVGWRTQVMPVKFLGPNGGYTSDAIEALDYAVTNGAKISNNSWGGFPFSQAMLDALKEADGAGHLFVSSAGNKGVDTDASPHYPSGYDSPNVISVAATDPSDSLAVFSSNNGSSNYGATSVDLAAPGDHILSTLGGNAYGYYEGTSMAAPHVAGAAALLEAQNPVLGHAGIKAKILESVDKRANLAGKMVSGGRLNVGRALGADVTRNTAPKISTPRPAPASTTRDRTPTIRATVRDAQPGLTTSAVRLYVDGRRVTTFTYNGSTGALAYTSRRLSFGRHTVKMLARDAQGLTTRRAWGFKVAR